jgi:hypothetical protein
LKIAVKRLKIADMKDLINKIIVSGNIRLFNSGGSPLDIEMR